MTLDPLDHATFAEAIAPVVGTARQMMDYIARLRAAGGLQPRMYSPVFRDRQRDTMLEGPLRIRPATTAHHYGGMMLYAAEEHLDACCRLLEHPETVAFADKVLMRATIEACARAHWLLDPAIGWDTRASRGMAEHIYGMRETLKISSPTAKAKTRAKVRKYLDDIATAGIVLADRPGPTDVMEELFAFSDPVPNLGTIAQGYLSLFVHSTSSGLTSAVDISAGQRVTPWAPEDISAPIMTSSATVNMLLSLSTFAYMLAAASFLRCNGRADEHAWRVRVQTSKATLQSYF